METALFAKMRLQIQNIGIILDHIQDMRMIVRHHEVIQPFITGRIEARTSILIN